MESEQLLEQALRSAEPQPALRSLVQELAARGQSKAAIVELFEGFLGHIRKSGEEREADEDALMDVLDCLVRFCSPHAALLPEQDSESHAEK